MKPKTIIGVLLLAAFTFLVVKNFGEQVSGYMTFAEAKATQARAHVVGERVPTRPASYDRDANRFTFFLKDEDGGLGQVIYDNPKPANFEDADKVVVDGHYAGDVFVAENILIKCPSKYNESGEFEAVTASATPSAP